jgi:hemerythrin
MPAVTWTPEMSVGVDALDTDHKMLVSLINQLADAIAAGEARALVASVLNGLLDYTVYHFGREEAMMAACAYPGLAAHREIHADLIQRLHALRDAYLGNPDGGIEPHVLEFMKTWLAEHVLGHDRHYAPAMAGRALELARVDDAFNERLAALDELADADRDVA